MFSLHLCHFHSSLLSVVTTSSESSAPATESCPEGRASSTSMRWGCVCVWACINMNVTKSNCLIDSSLQRNKQISRLFTHTHTHTQIVLFLLKSVEPFKLLLLKICLSHLAGKIKPILNICILLLIWRQFWSLWTEKRKIIHRLSKEKICCSSSLRQ